MDKFTYSRASERVSAQGSNSSHAGCETTSPSGGAFLSCTATQTSSVLAASGLAPVVVVPSSPSSSPRRPLPSSHLIRLMPASHRELSDNGAGKPLPADSKFRGEGNIDSLLCKLSPVPPPPPPEAAMTMGAKVSTTTGDGALTCTVVIE